MKYLTFCCCLILFGCDGGNNLTPNVQDSEADETLTGSIGVFGEVEVNDDISMANPVTIPVPSPSDDYVGFQVSGTIAPSTDGADTFAFTAHRRRLYAIELCTFACEFPAPGASLRLSRGYFHVLDQYGNLLLTSDDQVGRVGNYREIIIDAGVLYYVSVIAQDSEYSSQNYSLIAVEIPF